MPQREIHDHWFHLAKREGYVSRAAYKLSEIDERRKVLRAGDRVLDCGCAPGSWLQVASERVGEKGLVVGVDLQPAPQSIRTRNLRNVRWIEADLRGMDAEALRAPIGGAMYDVVLSDMAPRTTGDATTDHYASLRLVEALLERCPEILRAGGALVVKVFEGPEYPALLHRLERGFGRVKGYKPKASRAVSREMYIIAQDHHPRPDTGSPPRHKHEVAPPPPAPPPGWSSSS